MHLPSRNPQREASWPPLRWRASGFGAGELMRLVANAVPLPKPRPDSAASCEPEAQSAGPAPKPAASAPDRAARVSPLPQPTSPLGPDIATLKEADRRRAQRQTSRRPPNCNRPSAIRSRANSSNGRSCAARTATASSFPATPRSLRKTDLALHGLAAPARRGDALGGSPESRDRARLFCQTRPLEHERQVRARARALAARRSCRGAGSGARGLA